MSDLVTYWMDGSEEYVDECLRPCCNRSSKGSRCDVCHKKYTSTIRAPSVTSNISAILWTIIVIAAQNLVFCEIKWKRCCCRVYAASEFDPRSDHQWLPRQCVETILSRFDQLVLVRQLFFLCDWPKGWAWPKGGALISMDTVVQEVWVKKSSLCIWLAN